MTEHTAMLLALLALTLINAAVTVAVARSGYYERRQLLAQAAIVWLIPVIGALIVGVFLRTQRESSVFDTRAYPEPSEKAVILELDSTSHGEGSEN